MKRFFKRACIVFIVAMFFAIAVYLPEIDAGILERQNVNRYTLVKQDQQELGIHYDLPLVDKLLSYFYTEVSTEILSIHSIGNLEFQDEALMEGLQSQIAIWEKAGLIPELVDIEHLRESFDEALYYNISNVENPSIAVPVWRLEFYESESFHYQFMVDASTYKIYSASIQGYDFYDFWLKKGIFIADVGKMEKENWIDAGDEIKNQLRDYYEAEASEILDVNAAWDFVLEGELSYSNSYYDTTTTIPFYMYSYPAYKGEMGSISIGIVSDREGTGIEYSTSADAK